MKKVYHEDCGCGCGHDHDHEHEFEEIDTMILMLDDDTEVECEVIGVFDFEEKEYIALVPTSGEYEDEILVFEYKELEGDEVELGQIEDEEEYNRVLDHLDSMMEFEDEEDEEE